MELVAFYTMRYSIYLGYLQFYLQIAMDICIIRPLKAISIVPELGLGLHWTRPECWLRIVYKLCYACEHGSAVFWTTGEFSTA